MRLIWQDPHYAAFYKPAGLLVHRSRIDRAAVAYAMQAARDALGRRVYPVHRLDKPTAGILVFALDPDAARRLTERFAAGAVRKTYLAVVRGHPAEQGVIDYPLTEEPDPMTDALADPGKPPQPAVTAYQRLATVELPFPVGRYATARYALLEVSPRTGRRHQIRRHLRHVFHPVVGDTTHGDGRHNAFFRAHFECRRLMLCATRLAFDHPLGGMRVVIATPPDEALCRVFARLGWAVAAGCAGHASGGAW